MLKSTALRPARIPLLGLLGLMWGSNFLLIKVALRGLSPGQIVFVRLTLGALVLLALLYARGERLPGGAVVWGHLAVAAVLANVVPYLLFAYAERRVDSSIAGILNATTPLWTVLVVTAVHDERRPGVWAISGFLAGFAGTLLIFQPWRHGSQVASAAGLECLIAAALYALSFVYMAHFLAPRGDKPLTLAAGQLAVSSSLTALTLPFIGLQAIHVRADALLAVIALGAIGTGAAFVVNYELMAESGASATSSVTYLLPIVAILLGAVVLHESVSLTVLLGTGVVLSGVMLTRRTDPARRLVPRPRPK